MSVLTEKILKNLLSPDNTYRFISNIFKDEIYIYSDNGSYKAISGFCPHFGGPLTIEGNFLTCNWHGWKFDTKTLRCLNHNVNITIKSYFIKETNDILLITNDN